MSVRFIKPHGPFTLKYLANHIGASLYKEDDDFTVMDIAPLSLATIENVSMLHDKKYINEFKNSLAGACIIAPQYVHHAPEQMHLLVHENPYKGFALIAQLFYPIPQYEKNIALTAFVASSAIIGERCSIAHNAYISEHARIGDNCSIGVNTFIGDQVVLGNNCIIENNVSIQHTHMGNYVSVHSGAKIGKEGFGFASDALGHYKIPHIGAVIIGNNVEIGANTCVDRGSLCNTIIEDWCRLDNLVQIGHNVFIGEGSILCGQVGIAGSARLGKRVVLGGKVGVSSHVTIGNNSTILAGSTVLKDVPENSRLGGYPALPDKDWHKQNWLLKKLVSRKISLK